MVKTDKQQLLKKETKEYFKKSRKKFKIITIILSFLIVIEFIISFVLFEKQEITIKKLENQILEQIKIKNNFYEELSSVRSRMENIKTLDDLLERDIKLYIKSKYRKVPKSVAQEIASNVIKYGKEYDISPFILVGIIQVESGFNPMITGPSTKHGNARGLMQVMPEWTKKFALKDVYELYDINTNIESGCKVFNIHKEEVEGSISKTLYKYVNGDKKYVTDVFTAMGKFIAFRSTIDNGQDEKINENEKDEDIEDNDQNKIINAPEKEDLNKH